MRSRSYPNCRYGYDHNAFWILAQCIMGLYSGKQSAVALFGIRDESTISTPIWNFTAKIYCRIPSFYIWNASQDLHKNTTLIMPIFGSTTSRGVNTFAATVREDHRRSFLPRGGLLHVFCNVFCKIHTIAADVLAIRETKLFVQWEHSFHKFHAENSTNNVKKIVDFQKSGQTYRRPVVNPRHQLPVGQSVTKPETPLQNIQVE